MPIGRRERPDASISRLPLQHPTPASLAGRGRRLDAAIGQREQQPDDEAVREQRRPAVADERQRHPGERQDLEVAGRDDECLDADDQREARGEQRRKSSAAAAPMRNPRSMITR